LFEPFLLPSAGGFAQEKNAKTHAFTIGTGVSLYAMPVRACEIGPPPQGPDRKPNQALKARLGFR
jgi:hypothetical protein